MLNTQSWGVHKVSHGCHFPVPKYVAMCEYLCELSDWISVRIIRHLQEILCRNSWSKCSHLPGWSDRHKRFNVHICWVKENVTRYLIFTRVKVDHPTFCPVKETVKRYLMFTFCAVIETVTRELMVTFDQLKETVTRDFFFPIWIFFF